MTTITTFATWRQQVYVNPETFILLDKTLNIEVFFSIEVSKRHYLSNKYHMYIFESYVLYFNPIYL